MAHVLSGIDGFESKLNPCPFCGGTPEWVLVPGNDYIMRCSVCHASTGKARLSPEDAATDWNASEVDDNHCSITEDTIIDEYLKNPIRQVLFSSYIFDEFPTTETGFLCSNAVIVTDGMILLLDPHADFILYDELSGCGACYNRPIAPNGTKVEFLKSTWESGHLSSVSFKCGDKTVTIAASAEEDCMIVSEA